MNPVKEIRIDGGFAVALRGHIDSANAAEVEDAINGLLAGNDCDEIVLDAEELEHISSAGLRILLRLIKSGRNLKMINASAVVFEVMETTGFSELMPVQKAYRRVSIEGCEVIGRGANGTVYRLDDETIVKVYRDANALDDINRERETARRAFILGIPTAIPYDIVRVGDAYGSIFELLNAASISRLIADDPQNVDRYVGMYVDLLKQIHATKARRGDLSGMKAVFSEWAGELNAVLPKELHEKLVALIEAVPDALNVLHGDYHSNNVMVQDGEAVLIDMDSVCCGHPVFEFAAIYNSFVGFGEVDHSIVEHFLGIPWELTQAIFDKVLRRYFNTDDPKMLQSCADKVKIVAYTRLLRRTLFREADTERGRRCIEHCSQRLAQLLPRVDTLLF